jgi:antitoxin YefM
MKTTTVTEFRTKAKDFLEAVEKDQDILVLSRPKQKEGFVILTLSHYSSLVETAHLMSTPANAQRLLESIAQDKAGNVTVRQLDLGEKSKPRKRKMAYATNVNSPVKRKK